MGKVYAVAAGKGGVGKSSVCVQLALALSRLGKKVALLDADLYGPSLHHLFPSSHPPVQTGDRFLPAYTESIAWMSLGFFREEASMRAPMANLWIKQLFQQVDWGEFDVMLIDFPPGTGDIPLSICQTVVVDGALLVTMPGALSCIDVDKAATTFQKLHVPLVGVVENMSYLEGAEEFSPFGRGGGRKLAERLNTAFLGEIPLDPALNQANDFGGATSYRHKCFEDLATQVLSFASVSSLFEVEKENWIASELQKKCPCAHCNSDGHSDETVMINSVKKVGRYGYRFTFSSGCLNGIYEESYLKQLRETCVEKS